MIKFVKNFSLYALTNIVNAAIPFLLLPFLTARLSKEGYGILTNVDVFTRFTLPFVLLGINGAINTAFFREKKEHFSSYLSSALLISFISALLLLPVCWGISPWLSGSFQIPPRWALAVPLICLGQTFVQIVLGLYMIKKEPLRYGAMQVSLTLMNFLLSIFLVYRYNWEGRLYGIFITYLFFLAMAVFVLLRNHYLTRFIKKTYIKDALLFGIPLIPHMISGPVIQFSDRFFITHYAGLAEAGLYNVGYQIGVALGLITFAFNQSYVPYLYENLSSLTERKKQTLVLQSYLIMGGFLLGAFALQLVAPLLFKWFIHPRFHEALRYVNIVAIGSAFGGMYYVVANYIFYEKKTKMLALITFCNALLSITLNSLLTRKYGALGAAWTYTITSFFVFISVWILSMKVFPMPWFRFPKKMFSPSKE